MSVEPNKAAVERFGEEVFNDGDLSASEELITPDIVDHDPAPGQAPGREGIEQFVDTIRTAFPDLQTTIDEMIGEGDYVAFRYAIEGTHQGEFMGVAPTGKRVSVSAGRDRRVGERRDGFRLLAFLRDNPRGVQGGDRGRYVHGTMAALRWMRWRDRAR